MWVKFVKILKQQFQIQFTVKLFSDKAHSLMQSKSEFKLRGNFIIIN